MIINIKEQSQCPVQKFHSKCKQEYSNAHNSKPIKFEAEFDKHVERRDNVDGEQSSSDAVEDVVLDYDIHFNNNNY